MAHHHNSNRNHHHHVSEGRNLLFAVMLNFTITIAEFVGGIFSNSLALISDAVHNLSDAVALLITYITVKVSKRASNQTHTFGYKRIQIIAALFNAVTLIAICIYLLYEAYLRFQNPEPIKSVPMFVVAFIGLVANLVSVFLLQKHSKENLNIKAAYLHLVGDTLSSVAVLVGGVLIYFFEVYWIDPLITVLISLYIIKETYSVIYETYKILMQSSPSNIEIDSVEKELMKIEEIKGVHHVHIWNLTDKDIHFEGHLDVNKDMTVSESQGIIDIAQKMLKEQFDIGHATFQLECNRCDDKSLIIDEKRKN
jgi:cobalt-zinc-cadmium efflux system protein